MSEIPRERWDAMIARARKFERPEYARQLEQARTYLREGRRWWRAEVDSAASAIGSAEVAVAEVGSGLERPSSLDTTVVAGLLRRSPRWVRKLCADEILSATRLNGRWVIDRSEVDEYLMTRKKNR
ncbi:helix-turn-helix domain-containing protein [Aeromicrobium sp.]|uniref:helix-turn-helix domain-containing protein n=1 Tax=Aeromicrobium sp. TaxID=1871063 RepID=UPI0030BF60BD